MTDESAHFSAVGRNTPQGALRVHVESWQPGVYPPVRSTVLTLRSKTIDGVYQEVWDALTAYNLVRLEMAKAALDVKCDPTEISFIRASHVTQYELRWAAVTRAQGKLPSLLKRLHKRLIDLSNEERPGRKFDRAVKALPQRYAVPVLKKDLN
ncbi:MAG: hypothetical protein ACJ8G3_00620 [Burkholderiaceae bacterium]